MRRPIRIRRSRGFALMALIALLVAGVLYLLVATFSPEGIHAAQARVTQSALAEAKMALIGRAVTDNNHPGSLPCPDTTGEGNAESMVGNECPSYVGWLPWRTLKIGDIRDSSGERLGYALSRSLRDDNSAEPINTMTAMALTLNAVDVAALVIAAGPPLTGQSRPSNNLSDYLEGSNADGDSAFVALEVSADFNDQLLSVTAAEIFTAAAYRVAAESRGDAANGLYRYFDKFGALPFPASAPSGNQDPAINKGYIPYSDLNYPGSSWLNNNRWFDRIQYQRSAADRCTITVGPKSYEFTFH
jgi:hypothetical protein